nr:MAG TPA: hypothetical protein [Caudoviricetes sp.]
MTFDLTFILLTILPTRAPSPILVGTPPCK